MSNEAVGVFNGTPRSIINLIIMAVMATVCAIADSVLEHRYFPLGALWLYGDDQSGDNPSINGLVTFAFSFLTSVLPFETQPLIDSINRWYRLGSRISYPSLFTYRSNSYAHAKPLSFTSIAICVMTRRAQRLKPGAGICLMTLARSNIYFPTRQVLLRRHVFWRTTYCCNADNHCHVFKNFMVFRQCSVGGRAYKGDPVPLQDGDEYETTVTELPPPNKAFEVEANLRAAAQSSQSSGTAVPHSNPKTDKVKDAPVRFKDLGLLQDLEDAVSDNPDPQTAMQSRLLNGFFTVLALCHTVLTSVDPGTGEIEYKAQSPDEAALVQAAADVGFVFCGRDKETLSLRTPSTAPEVERYELLNILEFTSARKRMSVVLRKLGGEDERLFLLTKGADNIIFERLRSSEEELKAETEIHLSEFANEGLRTLTLAYKIIGGMSLMKR